MIVRSIQLAPSGFHLPSKLVVIHVLWQGTDGTGFSISALTISGVSSTVNFFSPSSSPPPSHLPLGEVDCQILVILHIQDACGGSIAPG